MSDNQDEIFEQLVDTQKQILEELENISHGDPGEEPSVMEKFTDKFVAFMGSWKFVCIQALSMFTWIMLNFKWLSNIDRFDPYPFILLNLALSFQAAFATPFILMAANRSEQKDRRKAVDVYRSIENIEKMFKRLHRHIGVVRKNGNGEHKEGKDAK